MKMQNGERACLGNCRQHGQRHDRYFNRDVECIRKFFKRRFKYESTLYPRFSTITPSDDKEGGGFRLDVVVAASGFTKKDQKVLEEVSF